MGDVAAYRVLVCTLSPVQGCMWTAQSHHNGSLGFFIDLILPALGSNQPLIEMSTKGNTFGVKAAGA